MHRILSRSGLLVVMLIVAAMAAACATLPPVANPTPTEVRPAAEPDAAGTPTPEPPVPGSLSVVDQAQAALAQQLGAKPEDVKVVSSSQVDWPNGCLGIQKPGIMCTQAIVPGYQVILEVNGKQYEVRTDLTGQQVAVASETTGEAALPEAAARVRERAAVDLGTEQGMIQVVSADKVDWPDGCLGVPDPTELCAQMVTPGYRVTVETDGKQYVYRTDLTGDNIRAEKQPQAAQEFPPAALAARDALAKELGAPAESITVQRAEPAQFTDSCLGLGGPAESCLQAITPGYNVTLEYQGEQYVYHTDQTGSVVRMATNSAATPTPASGTAGQASGALIALQQDVNGSCVDVRVDLQGVSMGACGMDMAASGFLTTTNRLEQLADMERTYAPFGASTAAGKVTFAGEGTINASPDEQRMIAEWANLVALETRSGTRIAQSGLEWHREGGIAGFCDDISVDTGGHATWTSCKAPAGASAVAPSWRRLTSAELAQFYAWVDHLGVVNAEQKDPATADAMTVRVNFAGRGDGQATDTDKNAMLQFGNALIQQWAEATPARYISTLAEVSMRSGPGDQFDVLQKIAAGQQAMVTGVSKDSQWWRVICPDSTVGNCWVSADPKLTQPIAPAGSTGLRPGANGQASIDDTQILAAVVRRIYTVDDTFGGTSKLPLIYLLSVEDSNGSAIPYASPGSTLPAPVQQGVVAALADLPAQFKWVESAGEVKRNKDNVVEGNGAIITLGKVRPQEDGSVQVTSSIYLGPMAAGGQTYILENQGGEWKVTGTTGSQWIS